MNGKPLETMSRAYPWILLGLLWCVSFLNQANRSILVVMMPAIRHDFSLSDTQLALLNTVFLWTYALGNIFTGFLGDRMSRSRLIIWGLGLWSLVTGVVPLATNFIILLSMRGLIGLWESSYYPAGTALIGDWFAPDKRSRALSLHQTAVPAGAGIGAFVAAVLGDYFGWRSGFFAFAVAGILYALFLSLTLRDCPSPARPTAAQPVSMKKALSVRPAVYLYGVFFFATAAYTGVMTWMPTYVHDALGFNLAGSALYGAVPIYIALFIAMPLGGFLADWLMVRTPAGRLYVLAGGLAIATVFLLPLGLAKSGIMVALILLLSNGGKGLFDGCIYAAMHDVVPAEARASAVGLMTAAGFAGAGLAPLLVAQIANVFGMAAGLSSLSALYIFAIVLLVLSLKPTKKAILAASLSPLAPQ